MSGRISKSTQLFYFVHANFGIEQHTIHGAEDAVVYHTMLQVRYNMYVQ